MITFVIGGARSGKSGFALERASEVPGNKAYIATAQAFDSEMTERIEKHKRERPADWKTYEEPLAVAQLVDGISSQYGAILIDCVTLWLSNLMMEKADVEAEIEAFLSAAGSCTSSLFIVSNEVGMGIVPENGMARKFRDLAGIMNQRIAGLADEVYLVAAGIPVKIKETK